MNRSEVYSRLCRLIGDCHSPHGELAATSCTPEIEKDLLINLSQVFRQIKQWKLELDSDSDSVSEEESRDTFESYVASRSHPHGHHCLAHIVAYLISLISIQKPLIQHSTANILVAISEFSSASETGWEEYIQLLCCWLKFALRNSISSSVADVVFGAKDSDFDSLISVSPMNLRLENLNCLTVAFIIRVLRDVLKLLKLNMNDKLLGVYLNLVTDTLSNLQWDLLNEVSVKSKYEALAGSDGHNLLQRYSIPSNSISIFHGYLVQLCCSLVDVSSINESGGNTDVPPPIIQMKNLIPKIVALCTAKRENRKDGRMFHYLRHKILMLLLRLVLNVNLDHSDLLLWLYIIENYFQDLLLQPLNQVNNSNQDCLEGSPFWADGFDGDRQISSRHLQRLVVFLLLRCSFTLENLTEKDDKQFALVDSVKSMAFELHLQSDSSSSREGLPLLQKWLIRHLPTNIFSDHENYPQRCMDFAQSFLKLYMHEDDLLFEMLLQLFCVPCDNGGTDCGETSSTTKIDFLCLVADLFKPIHLFHLFLAEILYDHQVLLDYLISKDTGAKSAEYLLRCLRMVCNSWNLFVEFPAMEKSSNSSRQKRRKILANVMEFQDGFNTTSSEGPSNSSTVGTDSQRDRTCGSKNGRTNKLSSEDAKGCLLSLKMSINSLYQKKLFPYNPQVLLRSLSRFEELCSKGMEEQTTD